MLRRLLGYGSFVLLATIVLVAGQRLDQADLGVPLHYEGDALLILPLVKCTVETGTHWRNDRLGAPAIQELYDFPIVDHFHFALLWLLGLIVPNYVYAFNIYHLGSYPLTVLTTMIVLRQFGLSFSAAGMAGMLYAFLPYHYIRGLGHYFLSAYWTLPLTLWPALSLFASEPPFFRQSRFTLRSWSAFGTILIALMTASAGAYYAFFGCLVLAFCGVYMAVAERMWKPLISAVLVLSLIVAGGIANHLPAILYQAKYGRNSEPTLRQPHEAEEYGLKLAQMLLPVRQHHWKPLADLRARYDDPNRVCQNENETSSLGLIGAITLIALLVVVFLPSLSRGRQTPVDAAFASKRADALRSAIPMRAIASLVLFLVLYGTIGGVGSVFNFLVTAQVRSINRISIVIAFFVFFAVAWAIDWLFAGRHWAIRVAICLGLTAFGLLDETNRGWSLRDNAGHESRKAEWECDKNYYNNIEKIVGNGSVFCLPLIPYPETLHVGTLNGYDHVRGYLHTGAVKWSFGAIKGREADQLQRKLTSLPMPELLERLVLLGFDGIVLDERGYPSVEEAHRARDQLKGCKGFHEDPPNAFAPLDGLRSEIRARLGEAEYNRRCQAERDALRVLWLDGFLGYDPKHRWCGPRGTAIVINPTNETRRLKVSMVIRSSTSTPGELVVDGGELWSESFALTNQSPEIVREWRVPPGRHTIAFRYRPSKDHTPHDARNLSWFVALFRSEEVPTSR